MEKQDEESYCDECVDLPVTYCEKCGCFYMVQKDGTRTEIVIKKQAGVKPSFQLKIKMEDKTKWKKK